MRIKTISFLMILSLVLVACGNSDDSQKQEEEHTPATTETVLDSNELEIVTNHLEDTLESDRNAGYMYFLDKIEEQEDGTLSVSIDLQQDPLPSADEVRDYTIAIADFLGTQVDLRQFENGVRVTMITRNSDDDVIIYGHAYNYDGEITFVESEEINTLQ